MARNKITNNKFLILIIALAFTVSLTSWKTIKDFHQIWPWLYEGEGLYEIDIGIDELPDATGVKQFDGLIVLAIGDLDDDKHADIVTLSDDQLTLTIFFYSEKNMNYNRYNTINLGVCKASGASVMNSPPYRLALICTEDTDYDYIRFLHDLTDSDKVESTDLQIHKMEKGSQPLFMDINSDSYVDIIYNTNTVLDILRVALYNPKEKVYEDSTTSFFEAYLEEGASTGCLSLTDKDKLKLSKPHFSTLTDVNADCISDLYLTLTKGAGEYLGAMLIAFKSRTGEREVMKFWMVEQEDLKAENLDSPVFADFDNDAAIDKAFWDGTANGIRVLYNSRGSNSASSGSLCRSMPTIADGEPAQYFKDYEVFLKTSDITKIEGATGLYTDLKVSFIPGQLRTGDFDSDGKIDIIATVLMGEGNPKTLILENEEWSTGDLCKLRKFNPINDYDKISVENSIYGFVMDFDDNGRLDFVIIKRGTTGTSTLQAFYNNYSRDSYYVTASTYTNSGSSYGLKGFGVSSRGVYTTLSDTKQVFVSEQLTRSSYGALQNTIATYAIGRSNNYIEDFTVAYHNQKINSDGDKYSLEVEKKSWSPIIPNSHLLIDIHDMSSSSWGIKLLINPTDSFILVGVILTLILILIGGLIIYIHMKEKKEDEQSRNPQLDFF